MQGRLKPNEGVLINICSGEQAVMATTRLQAEGEGRRGKGRARTGTDRISILYTIGNIYAIP